MFIYHHQLRSEEQSPKIFRIIRELLSQKKRRGKIKEIEMARLPRLWDGRLENKDKLLKGVPGSVT